MTQRVETEKLVKLSYLIKVHDHEKTLNDLAHLQEYIENPPKSSLMIAANVNCGHSILTFHVSVGKAAAVRYGLTQHVDFY